MTPRTHWQLRSQQVQNGGKEKTPVIWSFFLERVTGLEPVSPAWKAGIIAAIRYPQAKTFRIGDLLGLQSETRST